MSNADKSSPCFLCSAQADDLLHPSQHVLLIAGPCFPWSLLPGFTRIRSILIPIDTNRVRCLPGLPWLDAGLFSQHSQEHVQRLLEGVSAMLRRKDQELPHPTNQARLVLGRCQLPFAKKLGKTIKFRLKFFLGSFHNCLLITQSP